MKLLTSGLMTIFLPLWSSGQMVFSDGATVIIRPGAIVQVNGGVELGSNTTFFNRGTLTITKNSTIPLAGTFQMDVNATVGGDGSYFVEQDWVSNGLFNPETSTVTLFGNTQQFISGSGSVILFNNLVLTGNGTGTNRKKTLQGANMMLISTGTLNLNARELETQNNYVDVMNPSVSAITYSNTFGAEGFVSSVFPGALGRQTNSTAAYIFPTGSSTGTLRFRPVEIVPQTTDLSGYMVRLDNFDANTSSFDRSQTDGNMCALNPNYFHSIERSPNYAQTPADIRLFYVIADDGDWTGMAHWRTASSNWNDMLATSSNISGGFTTRTKTAWTFANPGFPYILSTSKPGPPDLNCPSICENSFNNVFSVNGGSGNFQWTFPSNGTITSGQGTATVLVDWTTGSGEITVVDMGSNGCSSQPGTCTPTIKPSPAAQFSYTEEGTNYSFTDETASSITAWNWTFGDGQGSSSQNPVHVYEDNGDSYSVTLQVTAANGCMASLTQLIEIFQDITVPNIITPNDDGTNDFFLIKTAGIKSYNLVIVNRWGNTVFTSSDPTVIWDGKSDGKPVDEGVYFYKLKASSATKEYNYQGNVTVVRN